MQSRFEVRFGWLLIPLLAAGVALVMFVTIVKDVALDIIEHFADWKKWKVFTHRDSSRPPGKWDMFIAQAQAEARKAAAHMKHVKAIQEMKAQAGELKALLEHIDPVDWTTIYYKSNHEHTEVTVPEGTITNVDYKLDFLVDAINHFLISYSGKLFLALEEAEQKPFLSLWIEGIVYGNELKRGYLPIASINDKVLLYTGRSVEIMRDSHKREPRKYNASKANLYPETRYFKTMNPTPWFY